MSNEETASQGESSASSPAAHPYSCLACRQRKKKCQKIYPCANCMHWGTECVFGPRRPSDREKAWRRLRHLEEIVRQRGEAEAPPQLLADTTHGPAMAPVGPEGVGDGADDLPIAQPFLDSLGQLTVGFGMSKYTTSNFWAGLDNEVDDVKTLLGISSHDSSARGNAHTSNNGSVDATMQFCFGNSCDSTEPRHPPPNRVLAYWKSFKSNCDLLVKVLHVPSIEPIILQTAADQTGIPRGLAALMFAIYFASVTSLSEAECLHLLGNEKSRLLQSYKSCTEQALSRAGLLVTHEILVLQAFVIYLASLRSYSDINTVSALTAMAVRLAYNCGLHRDGTHFSLSPFVTEMRRRLWWNIVVLDARACEDSGYESAILHNKTDTKMPLNINDDDITQDMMQFPRPKVGSTDMIFCLERFKAIDTIRRLQETSAGTIGSCGKLHADNSLARKSAWISEYQAQLQDVFLEYSDMSKPYNWYIALASRILLSKMWLIAYYPYLRGKACGGLSRDAKDSLFMRAISVIESHLLLCTGEPTRQWSWLCITNVQWYALTFVLSELCERVQGPLVQRAWDAVNATLQLCASTPSAISQASIEEGNYDPNPDELPYTELQPLHQLLRRACLAREHGQGSEVSPGAMSSNAACDDEAPYDHIMDNPLCPQLDDGMPIWLGAQLTQGGAASP